MTSPVSQKAISEIPPFEAPIHDVKFVNSDEELRIEELLNTPYALLGKYTLTFKLYLSECLQSFEKQGITVTGFAFKGGAVHSIRKGYPIIDLADVDFDFYVVNPPKPYQIYELLIQSMIATVKLSPVDEQALRQKIECIDANGQVQTVTFPSIIKERSQPLEISVIQSSDNPSFSSYDALRITPASLKGKKHSELGIVGRYSLNDALEFAERDEFFVESENGAKSCRKGYLRYLHLLTKGIAPNPPYIEDWILPEKFYQTTLSDLDLFLKKHYFYLPQKHILFLINFLNLIERKKELIEDYGSFRNFLFSQISFFLKGACLTEEREKIFGLMNLYLKEIAPRGYSSKVQDPIDPKNLDEWPLDHPFLQALGGLFPNRKGSPGDYFRKKFAKKEAVESKQPAPPQSPGERILERIDKKQESTAAILFTQQPWTLTERIEIGLKVIGGLLRVKNYTQAIKVYHFIISVQNVPKDQISKSLDAIIEGLLATKNFPVAINAYESLIEERMAMGKTIMDALLKSKNFALSIRVFAILLPDKTIPDPFLIELRNAYFAAVGPGESLEQLKKQWTCWSLFHTHRPNDEVEFGQFIEKAQKHLELQQLIYDFLRGNHPELMRPFLLKSVKIDHKVISAQCRQVAQARGALLFVKADRSIDRELFQFVIPKIEQEVALPIYIELEKEILQAAYFTDLFETYVWALTPFSDARNIECLRNGIDKINANMTPEGRRILQKIANSHPSLVNLAPVKKKKSEEKKAPPKVEVNKQDLKQKALAQNKIDKTLAIPMLEEALEVLPHDPDILVALGSAHIADAGKITDLIPVSIYKKAIKYLEPATKYLKGTAVSVLKWHAEVSLATSKYRIYMEERDPSLLRDAIASFEKSTFYLRRMKMKPLKGKPRKDGPPIPPQELLLFQYTMRNHHNFGAALLELYEADKDHKHLLRAIDILEETISLGREKIKVIDLDLQQSMKFIAFAFTHLIELDKKKGSKNVNQLTNRWDGLRKKAEELNAFILISEAQTNVVTELDDPVKILRIKTLESYENNLPQALELLKRAYELDAKDPAITDAIGNCHAALYSKYDDGALKLVHSIEADTFHTITDLLVDEIVDSEEKCQTLVEIASQGYSFYCKVKKSVKHQFIPILNNVVKRYRTASDTVMRVGKKNRSETVLRQECLIHKGYGYVLVEQYYLEKKIDSLQKAAEALQIALRSAAACSKISGIMIPTHDIQSKLKTVYNEFIILDIQGLIDQKSYPFKEIWLELQELVMQP